MIAFLGSVFSPWYAWARRGGAADPLQHCALHVALYRTDGGGGGPRRWAMTERGASALRRDRDTLAIGPSALHWNGTRLLVSIDERTAPWPRRLRGTITLHPAAFTGFEATLCAAGAHRWTPLSPRARVEVALEQPDLRWSGDGYLDGNHGDGAIEHAFRRWSWCRAPRSGGRTAILYRSWLADGGRGDLALRIGSDGAVSAMPPPPEAPLPRSRWGVVRATGSEDGRATLGRTLVDAPFYARSLIDTALLGERGAAVHESLDCRRFRSPLVQAMLPFRAPRAGPAWT